MSEVTNDPYAAPSANLENHSDAPVIPTGVFNARGRLSVLSVLAHSLILGLISTALIGVIFFIGMNVAGISTETLAAGASPESLSNINWSNPVLIVLLVLLAIVYIGLIYVSVCMVIKRLHDRNHSGWWSLALCVGLLIPFVNIVAIIAMLYVMFFPGQKTGNRFGGRRLTKGWEKVLGILYIVLIVGMIVLSIAGGAAMMSGIG